MVFQTHPPGPLPEGKGEKVFQGDFASQSDAKSPMTSLNIISSKWNEAGEGVELLNYNLYG
jgi:hypothetical protein